MNNPSWVVDPLGINVAGINVRPEESFIDLQSNYIAQAKFNHVFNSLWKSSDIAMEFPFF